MDGPDVSKLRSLRNRVVRISSAVSEAGHDARELSIELEPEGEWKARLDLIGGANDLEGVMQGVLRQVRIFADAAIKATGALALCSTFVAEDDPVVFNQMCRTTAFIDEAIWSLGGEL